MMVTNGKSILQLPIKEALYDANDAIVIVFGYDTANTSNSVAQTAVLPTSNFANSFASVLQIPIGDDPANSTALEINEDQIFASASYLYVAIATNTTARVALSSL